MKTIDTLPRFSATVQSTPKWFSTSHSIIGMDLLIVITKLPRGHKTRGADHYVVRPTDSVATSVRAYGGAT